MVSSTDAADLFIGVSMVAVAAVVMAYHNYQRK
jgi:hypothetical protein